jgi:uncharacterized membrane protein YccF (DUF307 family)
MSDENPTYRETGSPPLILRAVWFLLVGWEITAVWLLIAWILNLTVIGIPIGVKMINWVPKVLTLKGGITRKIENGEITIVKTEQRNLFVRAIYFVLIGWWLSLIWMALGYLLCISIIGLPFGIWILNRLPEITSLFRQG